MGTRLYVGNLPYDTDEDSIKQFFEGGGGRQVKQVKIVTDRDTGRPRGFAFVEMADDSQAQSAINELNGQSLGGRTIVVNEPRHPQRRARRGGGGGDGGGGGGWGGGGGGGGLVQGAQSGGVGGDRPIEDAAPVGLLVVAGGVQGQQGQRAGGAPPHPRPGPVAGGGVVVTEGV